MKAFHEKCDDLVDCNSQGLNSRTREIWSVTKELEGPIATSSVWTIQ